MLKSLAVYDNQGGEVSIIELSICRFATLSKPAIESWSKPQNHRSWPSKTPLSRSVNPHLEPCSRQYFGSFCHIGKVTQLELLAVLKGHSKSWFLLPANIDGARRRADTTNIHLNGLIFSIMRAAATGSPIGDLKARIVISGTGRGWRPSADDVRPNPLTTTPVPSPPAVQIELSSWLFSGSFCQLLAENGPESFWEGWFHSQCLSRLRLPQYFSWWLLPRGLDYKLNGLLIRSTIKILAKPQSLIFTWFTVLVT